MVGRRTIVWGGAAWVAAFCAGFACARQSDETGRRARVEALVTTLASTEFAGRRGAEARRTIDFLIGRFRELGLAPLFGDSYEQPFTAGDGEAEVGRNVGGWLEGSDPELRDEWVLVGAHFDHLGVRRGVLFPGADDNASGVAMLMEVAEALTKGERPRRGVAFVGFDREEDGLWGSSHFVKEPPRSLEKLRLMLVADMLGRSLGGVCDEYLFVLGSEHAPGLRPTIHQAAEGLPLKAGVLGSDLLMVDRSDYGPFRRRQIPYLFFTTGESPVYHSPEDRPETIDYPKLAAACTLVERVARTAVDAAEMPAWLDTPDNDLSEAKAVREVLARILEREAEVGLKPLQRVWLKAQIHDLDAAIGRGRLTPEERQRMVTNAQLVIYTIL